MQFWVNPAGPPVYEHEFQYYVDLLDPDLAQVEGIGPWPETNGVTYWLNVQAVFGVPPQIHTGWGWKTTPLENRWNDASVVWEDYQWWPAQYPEGHTNYPALCDLAFELTTDEVGTNGGPIEIRLIRPWAADPGKIQIGSMGDAGAGWQYLQRCTNINATNPLVWACHYPQVS